MKNKTLAIFGVGTYILGVITSATDLEGNFVSPIALIVISGIVSIVFIIMAAIRLWKEARYVSIILTSSTIILYVLIVIQEVTSAQYGSPIIILLNITKVINFLTFIYAVFLLWTMTKYRMTDLEKKNQRDMAEKLYTSDPKLAIRVAMGEGKPPEGILAVAIYGKVCDEVEKSNDIETSRQLANSNHNSKISAEAQELKFRDPNSAIEKMKEVVNARREAFQKTLPAGETYESHKKKMVEELRMYLMFLKNYVEYLFDTQQGIETKIYAIKNKTKQDFKDEQLIRDLWILRYTLLHSWFFNIYPPEDQNALTANISLINHAFQSVNGTSDYLPWLTKGFVEYAGTDQLEFPNLKEFESNVAEKISEKIPLIAFECTEGRLGGDLHDFVVELIMTTIQEDQKVFSMSDDKNLTEEDAQNIKNTIAEMSKSRNEVAEEFFDDLLGGKIK